jgi:hypothetical protein
MSYDTSDSLLAHPVGPPTVADQIAFEEFTDEQKRIARLVLHDEIGDEIYVEMGVDQTSEMLAEVRGEFAALTASFKYLSREGIERIYKNDKGFWLYPKKEGGEIDYTPYSATGPYATLEAAIDAGTK